MAPEEKKIYDEEKAKQAGEDLQKVLGDESPLVSKIKEHQGDPEEEKKLVALKDAATPKKKTRCYLNVVFLPGDGSPRLIPSNFRITQKSFETLTKLKTNMLDVFTELVEEEDGVPIIELAFIAYQYVPAGKTEKDAITEVFNMTADRIVSWSVSRHEFDGSIILPDEEGYRPPELDQSGGEGSMGDHSGGAGLVDMDGNPV
jgi:hypothetical protein